MSANDAFLKYEKETYGENTPLADMHIECFDAGYEAGVKDTLSLASVTQEDKIEYDRIEIRKAYAHLKTENMSRSELERLVYEKVFANTQFTPDAIIVAELKKKNPNALEYCKKETYEA
jgi:hypothetical protein